MPNSVRCGTAWMESKRSPLTPTSMTSLTAKDLKFFCCTTVRQTGKVLRRRKALFRSRGRLEANFYASSVFDGANVRLEKPFDNPDAVVTGFIQIRLKSRLIAAGILHEIMTINPVVVKTIRCRWI